MAKNSLYNMFLITSVRLRGIFRGKNLTQNSRCQSVKYFKGPRDEGRKLYYRVRLSIA